MQAIAVKTVPFAVSRQPQHDPIAKQLAILMNL